LLEEEEDRLRDTGETRAMLKSPVSAGCISVIPLTSKRGGILLLLLLLLLVVIAVALKPPDKVSSGSLKSDPPPYETECVTLSGCA
jgi:hypothetical protein